MSPQLTSRRGRRLVIGPLFLIGAFVAGSTLGPSLVTAANSAIQSVVIANPPANPVPVSVQGTPAVTVGNFPATQPVSGTVALSGTVTTGATSVVIATGS